MKKLLTILIILYKAFERNEKINLADCNLLTDKILRRELYADSRESH